MAGYWSYCFLCIFKDRDKVEIHINLRKIWPRFIISKVWEAALIPSFLFRALSKLNESPEMHFECPFNLIGQLTMGLLTNHRG